MWERWTGHPPQLKPSRVLARPHQRLAITAAIRLLDGVSPYPPDFKSRLGRRISPQIQNDKIFSSAV